MSGSNDIKISKFNKKFLRAVKEASDLIKVERKKFEDARNAMVKISEEYGVVLTCTYGDDNTYIPKSLIKNTELNGEELTCALTGLGFDVGEYDVRDGWQKSYC